MLPTLLLPVLAISVQNANSLFRLDKVNLSAMSCGWQSPRADLSVDGHPLSIGGQPFSTGVGTHARSELTLDLHRSALRFRAKVGLDDEVSDSAGSVIFEVFVDGRERFKSPVMRAKMAAVPVDVDLRRARSLRLIVDDAGDGINWDHADWAEAAVEVRAGGKAPTANPIAQGPTLQIAPVDLKHVHINGPRVVGCTPGNPFLFRIPATGIRPLKFEAAGLPAGVVLDAERGVLSGVVSVAGETHVRLRVSGPSGRASRDLTIVAGAHKLALTPPMGWNSWNVWAGAVDASKVRAAADSFVKTGLADFGYSYVNIDDCWEAGRDAQGKIQPNEKFPDMASLASYVHSFGLKLGIYSSPGPKTCAGFTASYQHELDDAQSYTDWGVDYLKYDWCSYGGIEPNPTLYGLKKPYIVMRESLDQVKRDIVFSLCQYGMGDVFRWGKSVGGNLWRTTGDINDSWESLSSIAFQHSEKAFGASPGGWNDPDMLVVGRLGWGANPRPTQLRPNEQITHISMWAMLAAPLIIGCDLTQIDDFTKALLMNPEVIDVDQDQLGKAATRRAKDGDVEVWARPLFDGSMAVVLVNRDTEVHRVTAHWADLELSGALKVRDLWRRRDVGTFENAYSAKVPGHGAILIKVGP